MYFFTKFRRSDDFFANFCENKRVFGVSTVSGISAAPGVAVAYVIAVACAPAYMYECVPDVASISAAAGIHLVPGSNCCWVPRFCRCPWCCRLFAVAIIPALAGVSAVAVIPALAGVFAVASFLADSQACAPYKNVKLYRVIYCSPRILYLFAKYSKF
jgi:hypothetical protein